MKLKNIFASLMGLSLILLALESNADNLLKDIKQPEDTVIVPDKFLRSWDPVTIFFDRPRGRAGTNEDHPDKYIKLSPDHPGAYRWLDTKTLQFRPAEPWPPLTRYKWNFEGKTFNLSTLVAAPVSSVPQHGANDLNPVESITLNFAVPLDTDILQKMLRIELRPLPGINTEQAQWLTGDDFEIKAVERKDRNSQATYVLNLFNPIPNGISATVHLRLSLSDNIDESFHHIRFSTAQPFELVKVGCPQQFYPVTSDGIHYKKEQAIECNSSNRNIQIQFSSRLTSLDPIVARNLVHITPAVGKISYKTVNNLLTVKGQFKTETLYRVNLEPTLIKDSKGRLLHINGSSEFFLYFPVQNSMLDWQVANGIMERYGPQMLPMRGRGFERLDIRIHPVDPLDTSFWPFPQRPISVNDEGRPEAPGEAPEPFDNINRYISSSELTRQIKALGSPSVSEIVALPTKRAGNTAKFGLDLSSHLVRISGKNQPGTYLVGMRKLDQGSIRSWVRIQVTDLSLTTINEHHRVRFIVTSLKTGRPIKNAKIEIHGSRGELLSAKTNSNGEYNWVLSGYHGNVRRIVVKKDKDRLVLDPSRPPEKYANNLWQNDQNVWLQWTQNRQVEYDDGGTDICHIFTERPVYKPTDDVHIKGYIRNIQQGEFSRLQGQGQLFLDGPGDLEWQYPVEISGDGSFYHKFNEEKLPTGNYQAYLFFNEQRCGSVYFKKEAFRLPKFEVQLNGPGKTRLDKKFEIKLSAEYYAGGQVVERPVRWRVTQFPYTWQPKKKEGFFYSTDARFSNQGSFRSSALISQEAVTDKLGGASLSLDPTIEPTAQPRRYVVEATVVGADDQTVTSTFQSLAIPPFVLGLKIPRYTRDTKNLSAEVLVANDAGDSLAGQTVTLRLQQRQWHSYLQAGDFSQGVAKYITEVVDEKIYESTFSSTADISRIKLPIKKAGVYIVEIEAQDKLGRTQTVKVDMFAGGDAPVTWSRPPTPVFKVTTDKQEYAPGEEATLILESPYQRAMALAIMEQPNGENIYHWLPVRKGTATFSLKMKKIDMPSLPVHFLLLRGRVANAKTTNLDLGKPSTLAATTRIKISTREHQVKMVVAHPKKAQPGDEIEVEIKLTDHKNKPLSGEVTLWLVDQSVLALGKEQPIDPLPDFIRIRDAYTHLRDTRNLTLGFFPFQEQPGGGTPSDSMRAKKLLDNVTVRKNFSPVPYFNPAIKIGKNGRARIKFKLPDNLTNFKVRAKVVSGNDRFGFYKGQLSIRLPVIVQPALPRFVRPGDKFTAIAIGRVVEGEGGKGRSELRAEGLNLVGDSVRAFNWDKLTAQRIEYGLEVPTPAYTDKGELERNSVTVTVGVERVEDKAKDAFRIKLPIRADRRAVKQRKIYSLTKDKPVIIDAINEPVRKGTLNRRYMISRQPELIRMVAGLSYLLEYPHGCTEQRISRARAQLASEKFSSLLFQAGDSSVREKVINDTLTWIDGVVSDNGLISYWPGSQGYVSLTAWVGMFLIEARDAGYAINESQLDSILDALRQSLRSDYAYYITGEAYAERSWALTALAKAGELDSAYAAELARKSNYLNLESLAQVIVALNQSSTSDQPQLTQLYDRMWKGLIFRLYQGKEIYGGLQTAYRGGSALILPSETRTVSQVLRAVAITPDAIKKNYEFDRKQVILDAIVRLGKGDGWGSTNANAEALLALSEYVSAESTGAAPISIEMKVGNRSKNISIDKKMLSNVVTQETRQTTFNLKSKPVKNKPIVLLNETRYIPAADGSHVKAIANGFVVRRELIKIGKGTQPAKRTNLEQAGTVISLAVGDVIEEHLEVVNPKDRNYIAVVIPLAAGLEPLNPALATAPPEAKPEGQLSLKPSYVAFNDDHLAYYYDSLAKGTYHFYFRTRATIPGEFIQPAGYAEMMYDEAVNGNSYGAMIRIDKKTKAKPIP